MPMQLCAPTSYALFLGLATILGRLPALGAPTCDSPASGACDTCAACCKGWLAVANVTEACTNGLCEACVAAECDGAPPALCDARAPVGTATNATCNDECLEHCWHKPWSPCLRDCSVCEFGGALLVIAMIPYLGRLGVD
jgi:hypothetical protein